MLETKKLPMKNLGFHSGKEEPMPYSLCVAKSLGKNVIAEINKWTTTTKPKLD